MTPDLTSYPLLQFRDLPDGVRVRFQDSDSRQKMTGQLFNNDQGPSTVLGHNNIVILRGIMRDYIRENPSVWSLDCRMHISAYEVTGFLLNDRWVHVIPRWALQGFESVFGWDIPATELELPE